MRSSRKGSAGCSDSSAEQIELVGDAFECHRARPDEIFVADALQLVVDDLVSRIRRLPRKRTTHCYRHHHVNITVYDQDRYPDRNESRR